MHSCYLVAAVMMADFIKLSNGSEHGEVSAGCQEQSSLSQRRAAGCRSHRSGLSTHLSLLLKISREVQDLPEGGQRFSGGMVT